MSINYTSFFKFFNKNVLQVNWSTGFIQECKFGLKLSPIDFSSAYFVSRLWTEGGQAH